MPKRTFKRRWFFLALVMLPVFAFVPFWLITSYKSRITKANFEKIQVGMTKKAVDDLLGPEWGKFHSTASPSDQICFYKEQNGILPTAQIAVLFAKGSVESKFYAVEDISDVWHRISSKISAAIGLPQGPALPPLPAAPSGPPSLSVPVAPTPVDTEVPGDRYPRI